MNDYFGILKDKKLDTLSVKELADVLIEKKIFYISNTIKGEIVEGKMRFDMRGPLTGNLSSEVALVDSLYNYLKQVFRVEIDSPFLKYFSEFEENSFGLETLDKKKIAIKDFKVFYSKVKGLEGDLLERKKSENGIEHVTIINRFLFLKGRQNAIKGEVASTKKEYIFEYLNGNENYFKKDTLLKMEEMKEIVEFESNLKILTALNDQFKFEEDLQFNNLSLLKDRFQKYQHVFRSFDVFVYTHKKIKSFTSKKPSNIDSLYAALSDLQFIKHHKTNFINYINQEHQIKLTKINSYAKATNLKHEERLQCFIAELKKYSEE